MVMPGTRRKGRLRNRGAPAALAGDDAGPECARPEHDRGHDSSRSWMCEACDLRAATDNHGSAAAPVADPRPDGTPPGRTTQAVAYDAAMSPEVRLERTRSADGTAIAWTSSGAGPALVMLPGVPLGDLVAERGVPSIGASLDALERRVRLVQYDGRGSGHSQRVVSDVGLGRTWPISRRSSRRRGCVATRSWAPITRCSSPSPMPHAARSA